MRAKALIKPVLITLAVVISIPLSLILFLIAEFYIQEIRLPDVCKHLWSNSRIGFALDSEFTEKIQKRYPIAVPRELLIKELEKKGFHRSPYGSEVLNPTFVRVDFDTFPCDTSWFIKWTNAPDGLAHDIKGVAQQVCL